MDNIVLSLEIKNKGGDFGNYLAIVLSSSSFIRH